MAIHRSKMLSRVALAAALWVFCAQEMRPAREAVESDAGLADAICPIVYPLDQQAGEKGYHYIFYGNGFFINKDGYLITAAHVLSQLREGPAFVLLRLPMAPPRLVEVKVVAQDKEHDVAVMRATPNPFEGKYEVKYLRLATDWPQQAQAVLAAAARPSRLKNPRSFDWLRQDRPSGVVVGFQFEQLEKGSRDTELFLFNHAVLLGESGAPVVSTETKAAIGIVEGQWRHMNPLPPAGAMAVQDPGIGAALPIHYAIALLLQEGISWQRAGEASAGAAAERASEEKENAVPLPLSLVTAPFPPNALVGSEVVLDARVDSSGRISDIHVLGGEKAFAEKAVSAVETWSFKPARVKGKAVEARVGITFQFAGAVPSAKEHATHEYGKLLRDAPERGALPVVTVEADPRLTKTVEGSVVLSAQVDEKGEASAIQVLRGMDPATMATREAVKQWKFEPGKRGGVETESLAIVVATYRRVVVIEEVPPGKAPH